LAGESGDPAERDIYLELAAVLEIALRWLDAPPDIEM
jgi:hypothetical protein